MRPAKEQARFSMQAFGAVFAEVAVDPDFGLVRVRRLVGVAPAIANAVFHATGTRVRDLPIAAESLLERSR